MDLVTIAPGHQLDAPAAAAWARAVAAGCPVAITSSYRSPERQADMRAAYLAALVRGESPAYVAPVAASEHVTGNALDLQAPAIEWVRAHPDFGFVFTDRTERWHVAYRISADQHLTAPADPAPLNQEDDDMTPDQVETLGRTAVFAQTAMQAADNATNAANRAAAIADEAKAAAEATRADVGTVANELRALARALGHPIG